MVSHNKFFYVPVYSAVNSHCIACMPPVRFKKGFIKSVLRIKDQQISVSEKVFITGFFDSFTCKFCICGEYKNFSVLFKFISKASLWVFKRVYAEFQVFLKHHRFIDSVIDKYIIFCRGCTFKCCREKRSGHLTFQDLFLIFVG